MNYRGEEEESEIKRRGEELINELEGRELECHYHTDKKITNFCEEEECLLPMCPTCVSIHSQFHSQKD